MRRRQIILAATALAAPAIARAQEILKSSKANYWLVTLSRDLEQPWSIAFLPDGRILITERPGHLRVFANGRADNPFVGQAGARPEIFPWGHRNPQGLALHPETGRIWEVEHGPRGGDELNILKAGANYGWPRATHGIDYNGAIISPHKSLPGMEDPLHAWVPSISPCGLCFYTGDKFPAWKGSLFTGALSNFALFRIELDGERYRSEERLLVDKLPYIRDVRQGPDGLLYLVTHSDDGGLFRLEPA